MSLFDGTMVSMDEIEFSESIKNIEEDIFYLNGYTVNGSTFSCDADAFEKYLEIYEKCGIVIKLYKELLLKDCKLAKNVGDAYEEIDSEAEEKFVSVFDY